MRIPLISRVQHGVSSRLAGNGAIGDTGLCIKHGGGERCTDPECVADSIIHCIRRFELGVVDFGACIKRARMVSLAITGGPAL